MHLDTMPARFRPLSAGEIIGQVFEAYRRLFGQVARLPLLLICPAYLVGAIVEILVWRHVFHDFHTVTRNGVTSLHFSGSNGALIRPVAVSAVVVIVLILLQIAESAAVVALVGQGYLGATPSWRSALRLTFARLSSVVWPIVLFSLVLGVLLGALSVLLSYLNTAGVAALGVVVAVVGAVYALVGASLIVPTVMLEESGGWAAVRRSFRLVRGRFWACLGVLIAVAFIIWVVEVVFQLLFSALSTAGAPAVGVGVVVTAVAQLLIAPLLPIATAFLYLDLRNRAEGLPMGDIAHRLKVEVPPSPPTAAGVPRGWPSPMPPPSSPPAGTWPPPTSPPPPSGWSSPETGGGWSSSPPSGAPFPEGSGPPPPWEHAPPPPASPAGAPAATRWPALSPKPRPPRNPSAQPTESGSDESPDQSDGAGTEEP